jgi:hypothetical protein
MNEIVSFVFGFVTGLHIATWIRLYFSWLEYQER